MIQYEQTNYLFVYLLYIPICSSMHRNSSRSSGPLTKQLATWGLLINCKMLKMPPSPSKFSTFKKRFMINLFIYNVCLKRQWEQPGFEGREESSWYNALNPCSDLLPKSVSLSLTSAVQQLQLTPTSPACLQNM